MNTRRDTKKRLKSWYRRWLIDKGAVFTKKELEKRKKLTKSDTVTSIV